MKELFAFLKDIFMITDESNNSKIGLSQFKEETKEVEVKPAKIQKEVKLSDLMRRSA